MVLTDFSLSDVSSETLLEDYWGLMKKSCIKLSLIFLLVFPAITHMALLITFLSFKKQYQKVKDMRDNMREKDLLKPIHTLTRPPSYEKLYLYALIDLKLLCTKILTFQIAQFKAHAQFRKSDCLLYSIIGTIARKA